MYNSDKSSLLHIHILLSSLLHNIHAPADINIQNILSAIYSQAQEKTVKKRKSTVEKKKISVQKEKFL